MIDPQKSLLAACSTGAAIVSTAGSVLESGAAVTLAALARPDMLIVAATAERFGCAVGTAVGSALSPRRPARTGCPCGYAPVLVQEKPVKVLPRSTTAAKSAGTTGSASSTRTGTSSKTSSTSSSSSGSSSKTSGPLGFLNDPKLSVEEKLSRFLCYMSDKYDKEIDKKLKEIGNQSGSTSSSSSSSKSSSGGGGFLGGLVGGGGSGLLGGILGGGGGGGGGLGGLLGGAGLGNLLGGSGLGDLITQASGPILAAGASVCGFPQLAPVLMKAGPELTQGALGLLGATGSSGSSSKTGSSSGSTSSSGSSSSSKESGDPEVSQKDMFELQRLQEKQKEMFSMVSNMLRAMHDTKMAVINNLRA